MTARIHLIIRLMAVLALSAAGLGWHATYAQNDYARVQRLLGRGQVAQALRQADDYIAAHPNDPQMRFIKAGALQAAGLTDKAEAMFTQLTRDYPELAEPWNNLAVLYAGRGQIDAAKTALEAALRVDPHYATALENLGDIDIRLALRYYEQAHKADPSLTARLSAKIDAARHVVDTGAPSSVKAVASSPRPAASGPQLAASQPEAAAPKAASAASSPETADAKPADATPYPIAGDLPLIPVTAPLPQSTASQPDAAGPDTASAQP